MATKPRVLVKDTIKDLNYIQRQQLPFVLAKTLTETARGAAQAVQQVTRREFELHTEFIPRGIRIKPAKKEDLVRFGFIEADVHTAPRISTFMPIHETGGTRRPFPGRGGMRDSGRSLAMPGESLRTRKFKTATGRVRKRWKPGELLKQYNTTRGNRTVKRSGRGGRRLAFLVRTKRGDVMVLRRKSRKRYPLERLYYFDSFADFKSVWNFEPTVRRYVSFAFLQKFERNMRAAVR